MSRPAAVGLLSAAVGLAACSPVPPPRPSTPAWKDVTAAAGIDFRHTNGAGGDKFLIETLGAGVCFLDANGDGRQDLFFVDSGSLPWNRAAAPNGGASVLYRNLDGERFEAQAIDAGSDRGYGFGCAAADIDNDGDTDLYVTHYGPNRLYRNRGDGRFDEVGAAAGVDDPRWGSSAAFADYDNDGRIDLYVANYVDFRPDNHIWCGENRPGYRTYCHPDNFPAQSDVLYRNNGDGTFTDATAGAGVGADTGKGLGVVWTDIDDDGRIDLYVANDATPNVLYRNRGDGTFEDITWRAGVGFSEDGMPEAGMGVDAGDYDDDGRIDLFVANLSHETNTLYRNDGHMGFVHRTFETGLADPSYLFLGFGAGFFDYDNDGDLDLYVNNGHLLDNIDRYSDSVPYRQRKMLFENRGGHFVDVGPQMGDDFVRPGVGRGAAIGDWDDDGDLDLVACHSGGPAVLLRNELPAGTHWIGLALEGRRSNRDGIGARVWIEAAGRRRVDEVRAGSSYLSRDDARIHFGLGAATAVETIRVRWPGGPVEEWRGLEIDRYHHLVEGSGAPVAAE